MYLINILVLYSQGLLPYQTPPKVNKLSQLIANSIVQIKKISNISRIFWEILNEMSRKKQLKI